MQCQFFLDKDKKNEHIGLQVYEQTFLQIFLQLKKLKPIV